MLPEVRMAWIVEALGRYREGRLSMFGDIPFVISVGMRRLSL
jgi:hypothetical protein